MTKIPDLDLHGVKHENVVSLVEDWAILWDYRVPAFTGRIITGNSSKMRILAEGALRKHKFNYQTLNDSTIIVNGKL
jgi:hypothetical protein